MSMKDKPDTEQQGAADIENETARIERLGRQRPIVFSTAFAELAFGVSIMLSIMMAVRLILDFPSLS